MKVSLPNNWRPRDYQVDAMNAWLYDDCLVNDWMWHRRVGKDDCALHGTSVKAHQKVANYWHMLPLKNQVRKAIWDAINPNTGLRRIDEAFPDSICKKRDTDMFIQFNNGSTWQALGSDNYKGAIGSSPFGIVWSEWPISDPLSYGYLAPILKENGGWVLRQGTPRGKNHGYRTFQASLKNKNSFAQILTVDDTGYSSKWDMVEILQEYIDLYGEEMGRALFEQEYYCSFEAAILGAVWGAELRRLIKEERFTRVKHDPNHKVFTAWDIGRTDATVIWIYQLIANEVRIIDYISASLKDPDYFCSQLMGKDVSIDLIGDEIVLKKGKDIKGISHRLKYDYEIHWLPHDARAKTFAAKGKSIQQQLAKVFSWGKVKIVKNLSLQDGISTTRKLINNMVVDYSANEGMENIQQYRYVYDEKRENWSKVPLHDYTSHSADALRMLAIAYKFNTPVKPKKTLKESTMDNGLSIEEMFSG